MARLSPYKAIQKGFKMSIKQPRIRIVYCNSYIGGIAFVCEAFAICSEAGTCKKM